MAQEASQSYSRWISQSATLKKAEIERALFKALLNSDAVSVNQADSETGEVEVHVAEDPRSSIAYPWNPAEAEAFFEAIEPPFSLADRDLSNQADAFFSHLDGLFAATTLEASIAQRFTSVPQSLIQAIARQAQQVAHSSSTLADQLVRCVQEALPQWAEDDLHVFARPLAYTMRDDADPIESTIQNLRSTDWNHLSEVEQARLSLAIARDALNQVERD